MVKKDLIHLDPCKLSFSEGTKILINKSLCPNHKDDWNNCKKLKAKIKTV